MMLTKQCTRGCGSTRKTGGTYLCVGTSTHGEQIEYFIYDPAIPWPYELSRAPKIIPDENGINHVYMKISENDYPSPWFHIMETKFNGLSRQVSNTFPIEKLIPYQSEIRCIYSRGIPRFRFEGNENEADHYPDCKLYNEDFCNCVLGEHDEEHPIIKSVCDQNPTISNEAMFCTFAHNDISIWLANDYQMEIDYENWGEYFEIHFPSINNPSAKYTGHMGKMLWDFPDWMNSDDWAPIDDKLIAQSTRNWTPAILLHLPLTHIEFPNVEDEAVAQRAHDAGFETFVLPY